MVISLLPPTTQRVPNFRTLEVSPSTSQIYGGVFFRAILGLLFSGNRKKPPIWVCLFEVLSCLRGIQTEDRIHFWGVGVPYKKKYPNRLEITGLDTVLLKRYILQPFETWFFKHQNTGRPPFTSCNVQVYNVRIPFGRLPNSRGPLTSAWRRSEAPGFARTAVVGTRRPWGSLRRSRSRRARRDVWGSGGGCSFFCCSFPAVVTLGGGAVFFGSSGFVFGPFGLV